MSKTKIIVGIVVLIILSALIYWFNFVPKGETEFNPQAVIYDIEGQKLNIDNKSVKYFGNEVRGDLNNDGREDIAYLITYDSGGSGTFYYAVVALNLPEGYKTTNAFFIGDRIAPQNNEIKSGELHINYAERKVGEPMTTPPSVGAVKLLKVTPDHRLVGLME